MWVQEEREKEDHQTFNTLASLKTYKIILEIIYSYIKNVNKIIKAKIYQLQIKRNQIT